MSGVLKLDLEILDSIRLLGSSVGLEPKGLPNEPVETASVGTGVVPLAPFESALARTAALIPFGV